jgi:dolichol-phosphate mannosyltransferase
MKKLAVCPCYNEAEYLLEFESIINKCWSGDVLFINDGSTDKTFNLIKGFYKAKYINVDKNEGYGAALKRGFQFGVANDYEIIITIDSDLQHDPRLLESFSIEISNSDIVIGSRFKNNKSVKCDKMPSLRLIGNIFFTEIVNRYCYLNITDALSGFRAYRQNVLKTMVLNSNGYEMPMEMWPSIARKDMKIKEIPIEIKYPDIKRNFNNQFVSAIALIKCFLNVFNFSLLENNFEKLCTLENAKDLFLNILKREDVNQLDDISYKMLMDIADKIA